MRKIFAFTLAEVLITLGIIGIVAALTIPTILNYFQQQQFNSAWKKAFSELNEAVTRIKTENNGTIVATFSSRDDLRNVFIKYLKYVQTCDSGAALGNCWPSTVKTLNPNAVISTADSNYMKLASRAVLADGVFIAFNDSDASCGLTTGNTPTGGICGSILVDVNGLNGPNTYGKDIFNIWIQSNKIIPAGSGGDVFQSDVANCPNSGTGPACSTKYLYQ